MDGALELGGRGHRVRGRQGGEAGEPVRVRAHRRGQPVVGLAGAGDPLGPVEPLGGRRHMRDDLQVDAVGVHVGQPRLAEIAQLVVYPLAPRGQRAGPGRRGEFGRPEVLLERNRSHLSHCASESFASSAPYGDPDGDPGHAAGVLCRAADHGVGPGRDPERFGDLVEQRLGPGDRAPARSAGSSRAELPSRCPLRSTRVASRITASWSTASTAGRSPRQRSSAAGQRVRCSETTPSCAR